MKKVGGSEGAEVRGCGGGCLAAMCLLALGSGFGLVYVVKRLGPCPGFDNPNFHSPGKGNGKGNGGGGKGNGKPCGACAAPPLPLLLAPTPEARLSAVAAAAAASASVPSRLLRLLKLLTLERLLVGVRSPRAVCERSTNCSSAPSRSISRSASNTPFLRVTF